jgi:4-cresol dehydrogenase (hydroxylating)
VIRGLDAVIGRWQALLGDDGVSTDAATLDAASTATFATMQRVAVIVHPRTTSEVAACLRVASEACVGVYPVSRGRNWGLGSKVPPEDGCALMDLSGMRAIVDYDESLGYLTVEPGVSFREAHAFLSDRGSRMFMNVTGASPDASLVGNALERGDGVGPLGDRFAHVCALEVALATGEVVRTGFARFGEVAVGPLYRWGVGPSLDGIFSQSSFGVVTRMTVWLSPLPRSIQAMRFTLREPSRLAPLVDRIRTLRLDGTFRATALLWNDLRILSTEARSGDHAYANHFHESTDHARWFGLTGLYAATELMGRALREHAMATLDALVDAWHIEERSGDPIAGRELLCESEPALGFLQGVPHERGLRTAYWSKSSVPERSCDLDRDRCGVLILCAAVPFRGGEVARACAMASEVIVAHGLDPLLTVATPTERVASLLPMIVYDRDRDDDDARAMRCHDTLLAQLMAEGWLPHRLGIQSMRALPPSTDDSRAVLARVKAALDPKGVLSPGRYTD